MKKFLLTASLLVALAGTACAADNAAIDDTFSKAKTWLSEQNLTLVGSPSATQDAALGQDALLFYGEAAGNPAHATAAQREMMAKRGAVVLAQRAAVDFFTGTALVGSTSMKDVMTQSDDVRTAVSGFLKGTQIVFQEFKDDKALAIIKVGLRGPKSFSAVVYDRMLNNPELKKTLTEVDGKQAADFTGKVQPVPEYDGLIVDATDQGFKPALINRIFSGKNELLYDPSKVSQKVLVEQGCGEYTNSVDKAKAALATRGIKNPLVVKAVGTVSAADLQVSDQDALSIYSANQKSGFLAGAKVAFVLK